MTTPPQPAESVRLLFERQLRAALNEAELSGDGIPSPQVERLARLARLVEASRGTAPPQQSRRWVIVSLLCATLALASYLLFVRIRQTEIEADLAVSEVSFQTRSEQPVARAIYSLKALDVAGVRAIHLPGLADAAGSEDGDLSVAISTREGKQPGRVSLAQLSLPAGSRVSIRRAEMPNQFRMVLETPKPLQLPVDVYGPVRVSSRVTPQRNLDLATPDRILLDMASTEADLLFTGSAAGMLALLPQIPIRGLSFMHPQQFVDPEHVGPVFVRTVSGILSGVVYLEELGSKAIQVRSGEALRFHESYGQIRELGTEGDKINLKFSGLVQGMQTGSETNPRNLMPTLLEWLKARRGLLLLWGTVFYLVSLSAGILRWLGVKV